MIYEVALYRESGLFEEEEETDRQWAVPIGTKLQLRVSLISPPVWRHLQLHELSLSSSARQPHAPGHVKLVDRVGRRSRELWKGIT